jgi:chemotaxis protein methyltransferase CheR
MYFTPETARAVVARISRALVPGGYLFLGHAETLRGLSHDFHLRHTHGTFYYQRRDEHLEAEAPPVSLEAGWSTAGAIAEDAGGGSDSWIDNIRRASERIQTLATGGTPSGDDAVAPRARPPLDAPDLTPVMESLAHERFAEALGLLHALPTDPAGDPDSLLLRAALLTHSGQLDAAERACTELLALDELNAGAHYLLALCRESLGDRAAAIDHDQVAVYLDPAFAMPRLHMGLLARRSGQREVARRELGLALPLLQREDPSRLLLFGGGFNRDALTALCRAELGATTRAES